MQNGLKRAFDIAVSGTALTLLAIPALPLAAAVYFTSGHQVLFRQKRLGLNGEQFDILKFQTMDEKRDTNGALLPDEQRVTKLGKLLRHTGLDELPQIFNILKGDMSIVGPRPHYIDEFPEPEKEVSLKVRPGLTGPWQVSAIGKNYEDPEERLALERDYAQQPTSLMRDIGLIAQTIPSFIRGHGNDRLTM